MLSLRMTRLARSFPTLRCAPGVEPWSPDELDAWACGPEPGSGAQHAARLVLAIWNDTTPWRCGRFDLIAAVSTWDAEHIEAMRAWAATRWLP